MEMFSKHQQLILKNLQGARLFNQSIEEIKLSDISNDEITILINDIDKYLDCRAKDTSESVSKGIYVGLDEGYVITYLSIQDTLKKELEHRLN